MGILLYIFVAITILIIAGVGMIFVIKNPKLNKVVFVLLAVVAGATSAMAATSLPTNYVFSQIFSWMWGVLAIVALIMKFATSKYQKQAKYLLSIVAVGALLTLYFI